MTTERSSFSKTPVASQASFHGSMDWARMTEEDWMARLTPHQYKVARLGQGEAPFAGVYWNTRTPGLYTCACCNTPLFKSDTKYDAGTGYPSYFSPVSNKAVAKMPANAKEATPIACGTCQATLGHVSEDGPPPTGLRYSVYSASLSFVEYG